MVWNHGLVLFVLIILAHVELVSDLLCDVFWEILKMFSKCLDDDVVSILICPLFSIEIIYFVVTIINIFVDVSHVGIVNSFIVDEGAVELPG